LLHFDDEPLHGLPAATQHRYGDGLAVYHATQPDVTTLADILRWVCARAEVGPVIDAPADVEAVRRGDVLFLINHGADPATLALPRAGVDLLSGRSLSGRVTLAPRDALALDLAREPDLADVAPATERGPDVGSSDGPVDDAAAGLSRHVETLADGRRRTSYRRPARDGA
jgi:hypothetical protein